MKTAIFLALIFAAAVAQDGDFPTQHVKWQDVIGMHRRHDTYIVADVEASMNFYQDVLGYRVIGDMAMPATPPLLPCPIRDILLERDGLGDIYDLVQFICPPGTNPPPMYVHTVYHVEDIAEFERKMTHNGVVAAGSPQTVNGITLACYYDPDNFIFCATDS